MGIKIAEEKSKQLTCLLNTLGAIIVEVRQDYAVCRLPLTSKAKQPMGVYHAGALLAIADEMASTAINGSTDWTRTPGKLFPYALQLSANFINNDPNGPIVCESRASGKGRTKLVETDIYSDVGPIAKIRSVHVLVDPDRSGPHK